MEGNMQEKFYYENLLNRHDCNEIKTIDKYDLVINLICY